MCTELTCPQHGLTNRAERDPLDYVASWDGQIVRRGGEQ